MCVIVVSKNGSIPRHVDLLDMQIQNPHGIGLAWYNPSQQTVHFKRGISLNHAWSLLRGDIKRSQLPYILHFRYRTHGTKSARLCHPFPITTDKALLFAQKGILKSGAVLAHNGIAEEAFDALPDDAFERACRDDWSDTACIAYGIARKGEMRLKPYFCRVATLAARNGHMRLYGDWCDAKGDEIKTIDDAPIIYSNLNWQWTIGDKYTDALEYPPSVAHIDACALPSVSDIDKQITKRKRRVTNVLCDGSHCTDAIGETRLYPSVGYLCFDCWVIENNTRFKHNEKMHSWYTVQDFKPNASIKPNARDDDAAQIDAYYAAWHASTIAKRQEALNNEIKQWRTSKGAKAQSSIIVKGANKKEYKI